MFHQLVRIDPASGARTVVGPFGFDDVSRIAIREGSLVPEPPSMTLLIAGIALAWCFVAHRCHARTCCR